MLWSVAKVVLTNFDYGLGAPFAPVNCQLHHRLYFLIPSFIVKVLHPREIYLLFAELSSEKGE